jgi:alpha-tubulin suppressor-like RCC1 family protein
MALHLKPEIIDVVCGDDYTMALSDDHQIYVWGKGRTGVLDLGPNTKDLYQAQTINSLAAECVG